MTKSRAVLLIIGGILAGLVNGVLGGGAGVVIVMLLLTVMKLSQRVSQATALLVVLPMTVLSAVLYIVQGQLPWVDTLIVSGAVAVGGVVGALLLGRLNNNTTKLIFALLLVAGGVKMIVGGLL